ncbi:MAG: DUF642 domain-containing protein [Pirellulales bacterium]
MRSMAILLAGSICVTLPSQVAEAEQIVNGGFELPVGGGVQTFYAPSSGIPGWTVTGGNVDLVNTTFFPSFAGSQSLDLTGDAFGTIEQSFSTTPGVRYNLSFMYADNPFSATTEYARVDVEGNNTLLSQIIYHGGSTPSQMNYLAYSGLFTADSSTATLRFREILGDSLGGILLDDVSVAAVPEPSMFVLLLVAVVGRLAMHRYAKH